MIFTSMISGSFIEADRDHHFIAGNKLCEARTLEIKSMSLLLGHDVMVISIII